MKHKYKQKEQIVKQERGKDKNKIKILKITLSSKCHKLNKKKRTENNRKRIEIE